jgi:RimJ/RimL family protein N-acetyltransferase
MISPPARLTTPRLVLRRPRAGDAAAVYAYGHDPEVTRYLSFRTHRSLADAEAFVGWCPARRGSGQEFCWLVSVRDEDAVAGSIACRVRGHAAEIGYVLGKPYWGRGYATEAGRAVVDWAVVQPEIHRVWAACDVENPASARVLEKLGMTREGVLRRWIVHPNVSATPRDCHVYARVR